MFTTYYFGRSVRITEYLYKQHRLQAVFSDFFIPKLYTFCALYALPYTIITTASEMDSITPIKNSLGVSYCYTRIFKKHHIELFDYGIWNIHPGALPLYRGKHPIEWAFYRNEPYIGLSIHTVSEQIDMGMLLAQTTIPRFFSTSLDDIENAVEEIVVAGLFDTAITQYKSGTTLCILEEGRYDPSFLTVVANFSIEKHTQQEVLQFFAIQKSYSGVEYCGTKYHTCEAYHPSYQEYFQDYTIVACSDGAYVAIK